MWKFSLLTCLVLAGVFLSYGEEKEKKEKEKYGTIIGIDLGTTYSW